MSHYRVIHNKDYTVINNTICRDNRLSWKAKGIWLYAFHRPDDWVFHFDDLLKFAIDGEKSLRTGLKELEDCGYLIRTRKKDIIGKFIESDWEFLEIPLELKEKVPQAQNRHAGFRHVEKARVEKEALLSTEEEPNTELSTTTTTTTTTSEEEVVVVSYLYRILQICETWAEREGEHWRIPEEFLKNLFDEYGHEYVMDQAKYMFLKHKTYWDKKSDQTSKEKPIDKPKTYLKISCKENWADSVNNIDK
jgi:hypothetical protein